MSSHAVHLALLLSLLAPFSSADVLTVEIPVDGFNPRIVDSGFGNWVWLPGSPCQERVGFPCVPAVPVRIAVPFPGRIVSTEVISFSYRDWGRVQQLIPVSEQVPVSRPWEFRQAEPDPQVYQQDTFFPIEPLARVTSGVLWGIPIATAVVHPVRWNPVSGELEIMEELTLQLEMDRAPGSLISRRSFSSEERSTALARSLVVNPWQVTGSGAFLVDERDLEYGQYVIICPEEFQDEFQVLADWKTSKGIPASVYTTQWIAQNYSFLDIQREIRAFLTDCRDEGTDFVLLAGDDDVLPARDVYLCSKLRPSDLYFADNDDTYPGEDLWDSNRNGYWAEPGDSVDWHPDLWVARAPVSDGEEAELFVNKVLFYEHVDTTWSVCPGLNQPEEIRIGYSTGQMSSNPVVWGSPGAELISDMMPLGWQEEKRYESQGNNSTALTIEMIDMGMHQLYHCSHGSDTMMYTAYGDLFFVSDIMQLQNISQGGNVSIWNSIACLIGSFDTDTCCADAWVISPEGGGFGCFNSDNGYYSSASPGAGASDLLIQRFFTEYIQNDVRELGMVHGLCLDHFCPPEWNTYTEYVVKGYNLFGDPELPMWASEAAPLTVIHQPSVNGNTTVEVFVSSGGYPLAGARVCLQKGDWQTGEVYEVEYTDASGSAWLYACPETTGHMAVTAWAVDHDTYSGEIQVTGTGIEVQPADQCFGLVSISPSPTAGRTWFRFGVAEAGQVQLSIHDLSGRQVAMPVDQWLIPGEHDFSCDCSSLCSGIYLVRLSSGGASTVGSLVVLGN